MSDRKTRVLFLCTGNSARSQIAEALLRRHAGDRFEVFSAGTKPVGVHRMTHRVLNEIGIDTDDLRSKGVDEFLGSVRVDYAIIVCARAQRDCPRLFGPDQTIAWPFDDPAAVDGSEEQQLAAFRDVRDQIDERIRTWLAEEAVTSPTPGG